MRRWLSFSNWAASGPVPIAKCWLLLSFGPFLPSTPSTIHVDVHSDRNYREPALYRSFSTAERVRGTIGLGFSKHGGHDGLGDWMVRIIGVHWISLPSHLVFYKSDILIRGNIYMHSVQRYEFIYTAVHKYEGDLKTSLPNKEGVY